MAETVTTHVVSATHNSAQIEGAVQVSFRPIMQISPRADGNMTRQADTVGIEGTLMYRSLASANTFLNNAKSTLVVVAKKQGQQANATLTFANCKAQGWAGEFTVASKDGPVSTIGVRWRADSLVIT